MQPISLQINVRSLCSSAHAPVRSIVSRAGRSRRNCCMLYLKQVCLFLQYSRVPQCCCCHHRFFNATCGVTAVAQSLDGRLECVVHTVCAPPQRRVAWQPQRSSNLQRVRSWQRTLNCRSKNATHLQIIQAHKRLWPQARVQGIFDRFPFRNQLRVCFVAYEQNNHFDFLLCKVTGNVGGGSANVGVRRRPNLHPRQEVGGDELCGGMSGSSC